jgi:hypothetical protein
LSLAGTEQWLSRGALAMRFFETQLRDRHGELGPLTP